MTDLTDWLRQQIDEDERVANAATPGPWRWGDWSSNFGTLEQERNTLERAPGYGEFPVIRQRDDEADEVLRLLDPLEIAGDDYPANAAHIARHDPARVLREVAAKRAIVEDYLLVVANGAIEDATQPDEVRAAARDLIVKTLRVALLRLASVYADRPGYDESWRP